MSWSSIFLISLPYLERAKFWLYKDQIKKKDKSTLQLERLWHWFGGTKALHKESQKSHFYTIAFAVFTFQDFLLSFLVWIQKSVFETVLIDLKKNPLLVIERPLGDQKSSMADRAIEMLKKRLYIAFYKWIFASLDISGIIHSFNVCHFIT